MPKILLTVALLTTPFLAACNGDDPAATAAAPTAAPSPTADSEPDASTTGTIAVHIEEVDGVFIEGFEVGIRFETAAGETVAATLWSDFVSSQGNPTIDDYYDSVLEQPVPSGEMVVLASANVGIGPGPEIPDVDGELRCRLRVDVPADGRIDVEVTFADSEDCLQLVF